MAIDFLIFGLLLISFTINLLALGAFWVTPGLRTTANRFVINLLIINLIGCCILAPTLFLSGNMSATTVQTLDESSDIITKGNAADYHRLTIHRNQMIEEEGKQMAESESIVDEVIRNGSEHSEIVFKCNSTYCEQLTIDEEGLKKIVITQVDGMKYNNVIVDPSVRTRDKPKIVESTSMMRCWSIDLAAALGALSVLLVVGDTWMAVTDPLRYHSRISGVKAWVLIAMTWALGILFGVMSAFREINFEYTTVIGKQKRYALPEQIEVFSMTSSTIFSMIFASIYFIVIILLPFGFVCGMYWRIFSEAKENGLRMRQNGSSPLLQSAINLSHSHNQGNTHLIVQRNSISGASTNGGGGLQMQIDHKRNRRESTVTIAETEKPFRRTSSTPPPPPLAPLSEPEETSTGERNPNSILLTLSSASGEIKRNYSVRQLPLLGRSSQDLLATERLHAIRQIHSTPNLQKYNQGHRNSLTSFDTTSRLRYMPHQALQIPTIHASPKALSYMTSIRHRLSNASSLFKYREESRAARISILVVIMFLVSYLPYGLLVLLQGRVIENFPHSTQLAVFMILLANLTSPFIFAYRNKRVRRGVIRLFGLDARSRERRLQRNGGFLRYGTKASISVKRSSSKVSSYSMNSCKYLTPILRHTNNSLKNSNNSENNNKNKADTFLTNAAAVNSSLIQKSTILENIAVDTTIHIQPDDAHEKFSIFKMFCQSSRNLSCATQSCTAEPTEV
ncbi:uncharacterized protein LOC129912983 [Episyrphus balteatus]|uniref:uncharacterized protein LOC129912983 n=1 Tax=Episyrphus balteatus TaxID=286459 RepID=UPI00248549AE|nr:uncharacterized protein LOC129912983 [Episyrphus balteatus]